MNGSRVGPKITKCLCRIRISSIIGGHDIDNMESRQLPKFSRCSYLKLWDKRSVKFLLQFVEVIKNTFQQ